MHASRSRVAASESEYVYAASPETRSTLAAVAEGSRGDLDVRIGGGPTVVGDFLAADLIDTLHVVQVPILRGGGVRLWVGVEGIEERYDVAAVSSPSRVTHLTFSVDGRSPDVRRGCSRPARSGRGMRDAPFFAPPTPPAP